MRNTFAPPGGAHARSKIERFVGEAIGAHRLLKRVVVDAKRLPRALLNSTLASALESTRRPVVRELRALRSERDAAPRAPTPTSGAIESAARQRLERPFCARYSLRRLIGIGGMAAVYAGTHRNGHAVAVKVLHEHLSADLEIEALFKREARLANSVEHTGVVPIIDDDVADDGSAFLVMPLLHGETLRARAARHAGGRLPIDEVFVVAQGVLNALAAAHARGIAHLDLKPENIFVTTSGEVKLLDFGIGRSLEGDGDAWAMRSGRTFGTPAFMAPEQASGREVHPCTDLWSLGATLFALLAGQCVHVGESGAPIAALAATRRPRKLQEVAPAVPAPLAEVVNRALSFEKSARWADAEHMGQGLQRAYEATLAQDGAEAGPIRGSLVAQRGEPDGGLATATDREDEASSEKSEQELRSAATRTMTLRIVAEGVGASERAGRGLAGWALPHRRRAAMAFAALVAVMGVVFE